MLTEKTDVFALLHLPRGGCETTSSPLCIVMDDVSLINGNARGGGQKPSEEMRHLEDQFFFLNTFFKSGQNSKTSQLDPDWGQSYVDQFFVVA